jgi:transposase
MRLLARQSPGLRQVAIALVVTPTGFPLAYEVLPGDTFDQTTLKDVLEKIQTLYGKIRRIWIMDRGIPTEEVLEHMRQSEPPVCCLVGTPKSMLGKLEAKQLNQDWPQAREDMTVKLRLANSWSYASAVIALRQFARPPSI